MTDIDLVVFRWNALRLGVAAGQVLAMESTPDPDAPSIGVLLGLPTGEGLPGVVTRAGPARLLRLAHPAGVLRVRVQEPVVQVRLPACAIHPLPPLLAARLRLPGIRALAWQQGQEPGALIIILDVGGLACDEQPAA
ncbi:MAG: hypothetical protein JZU52_21015 [Lamprocystis purpurea]|uniref:hypothetical protein n=1 Tax=Lamprocystis purpurea TaxID=61598 RepID=UPI0003754EFB|nr:hypothetical protein [Lamprocystis purpurea]MBV5276008.1 hypothetical protein [Lamprocystis purpurea]